MSSREEPLRFQNWRPPVKYVAPSAEFHRQSRRAEPGSLEPDGIRTQKCSVPMALHHPPAARRSDRSRVWSSGQHSDLAALQRGTHLGAVSQVVARTDAI